MMDILPDLRQAKDFVDKGASATNLFLGNITTALLTAMNTGKHSTTVSFAGQAVADTRLALSELNRKGYKAELQPGNVLAVSW